MYRSFLALHGLHQEPEAIEEVAQEIYSAEFRTFRFLREKLAKRYKVRPHEVASVLSQNTKAPWAKIQAKALERVVKLVAKEGVVPLLMTAPTLRFATASEERILSLPKMRSLCFDKPHPKIELLIPQGMTTQGPYPVISEIIQKIYPGEGWFSLTMHGEAGLIRTPYLPHHGKSSGWALYAGHMMLSHMKEEEQFFLLQSRALKAAHMMLEAQIHLNKTTPEKARKILVEEVGLSPEKALAETHRYVYGHLGSAAADYLRYREILTLKEEMKKRLKGAFRETTFNKKLARGGFLPIKRIRESMIRHLESREGKIQVAPSQ